MATVVFILEIGRNEITHATAVRRRGSSAGHAYGPDYATTTVGPSGRRMSEEVADAPLFHRRLCPNMSMMEIRAKWPPPEASGAT